MSEKEATLLGFLTCSWTILFLYVSYLILPPLDFQFCFACAGLFWSMEYSFPREGLLRALVQENPAVIPIATIGILQFFTLVWNLQLSFLILVAANGLLLSLKFKKEDLIQGLIYLPENQTSKILPPKLIYPNEFGSWLRIGFYFCGWYFFTPVTATLSLITGPDGRFPSWMKKYFVDSATEITNKLQNFLHPYYQRYRITNPFWVTAGILTLIESRFTSSLVPLKITLLWASYHWAPMWVKTAKGYALKYLENKQPRPM